MGATIIADHICQYFGGPYDAPSHTYRSPQITVPNVNGPILRRAAPKRDNHLIDYTLGLPGFPIGCLGLVLLEQGMEQRVAVAGAFSGLKQVRWTVRMHWFLRSEATYAEILQDATYSLLDKIRAHLEADRTCGTGGFEAGYGMGFQVGEGGEPWIRWSMSPVSTSSKDLSKQYLFVEYDADEYVQA